MLAIKQEDEARTSHKQEEDESQAELRRKNAEFRKRNDDSILNAKAEQVLKMLNASPDSVSIDGMESMRKSIG